MKEQEQSVRIANTLHGMSATDQHGPLTTNDCLWSDGLDLDTTSDLNSSNVLDSMQSNINSSDTCSLRPGNFFEHTAFSGDRTTNFAGVNTTLSDDAPRLVRVIVTRKALD